MPQDIYSVESGNPIYNGSITINPGVKLKTNFQYLRDGAPTTPELSSISGKYDTKFDDPRYYSGDTAN